ncbi:MAG: hypothetical protein ACXWC9_07005 [Pseudobdellovibrionaceae bacterium]
MKIQSVLLSFFLIVFAVQTQAGTVEVAQWIPWSSLAQEASLWPLNFQTTAQNFTLQWQEWKPQALQSDFAVNGTIQNLQIGKSGIQGVGTGLSAVFKVGQLALDQTVVKEIGGNKIEIRIKASCQPFEIKVPSFDLAIQAPFQKIGNAWQPVLGDLKLAVHDGWSVSPLVCEGPMGIEDRLTAIIQDSLKNPEALSSLLKNYLSPELQKKWQQAWTQITTEKYQELKISSMGEPLDEGFFLKGEFTSGLGDWQIPLPSQLRVLSKATKPQLVLSSEGFAAMARESICQYSIQKFNLQQVEAFAKLMRSRFVQFFVWSDLLHFSRSTPFYLSTLPDQKVDLQSLSGGRWQVQMQTSGIIEVSRKGQMRNYINWGVGLASVSTTEVKDSRLILQSGNPKTNLSWKFDPQYVKDFHPSGISEKVLKKATEALFKSRSAEIQLPTLQTKDRLWKLNDWVEDQGLIWMEWR